MRVSIVMLLGSALLAAGGCAKQSVFPSASVSGEESRPGAFLAYEHAVDIQVPGDMLATRIELVRAACSSERFGACSVLLEEVRAGTWPRGSLTLRVVPSAVEPLVAMAAEGATVGSRETKAVDLADDVSSVAEQRERLQTHQAMLGGLLARKDLAVGDLIALSGEIAQIETRLETLARTATDQRRRIETNLLTLRFGAPDQTSRLARIGTAFSGMADSATDGLAEALDLIGYGLPFLLFAFPLALLWRWLWRRVTRSVNA